MCKCTYGTLLAHERLNQSYPFAAEPITVLKLCVAVHRMCCLSRLSEISTASPLTTAPHTTSWKSIRLFGCAQQASTRCFGAFLSPLRRTLPDKNEESWADASSSVTLTRSRSVDSWWMSRRMHLFCTRRLSSSAAEPQLVAV